jgi:hypothetical protein
MSSQRKSKTIDVAGFLENPGKIVTVPRSGVFRTKSPARLIQERAEAEIVRVQSEIIIDVLEIEGRKIRDQSRINAEKEIAATKMVSILENTENAASADNGMLACAITASNDIQDLILNGRSFIKIIAAQANQTMSGVSITAEQDPNVVEADFEVNEQKQA